MRHSSSKSNPDVIRLRIRTDNLENYQKSHDRFDHTGSGKSRNNRLECACYKADDGIENPL
jgi:hypothetical protein